MFHSEFYPTPLEVIQSMQIDSKNKVVLEPHAGKGNIVDFLNKQGAKNVLAFEIDKDLQEIVKYKAELIGSDFFNCTAELISHIDMIIMNPPFSNADKHLIHAWKIAPDGCEIIAIVNYETIQKDYRYTELNRLISDYGISQNLGNCFNDAERKTNVEIGLIKLYKPVSNSNFEFNGFYLDEEEEQENTIGIMPFNEVRALVNRYVASMKAYDVMKEQVTTVNTLINPIGLSSIKMEVGYNNFITSKSDFSKILQKTSWRYIFDKMNLNKYVTSGTMRDINTFVETQTKVPFTMKNIYKMFEIIIGTRQDTFNKALEEVVDNFTKHTHENRFGIEGWKTNSGYMLNKKFIINYIVEPKYRTNDKVELVRRSNSTHLDDLVKVLCNLTGANYDEITPLYEFFNSFNGLETNKWYSWAFFEIKVFKKGTMHIKFQNLEHWYILNHSYGNLKGFVLPENYKSAA